MGHATSRKDFFATPLFDSVVAEGGRNSLIAEHFAKELPGIVASRRPPRTATGTCLLADVGEDILGLLHITCRLAERVVGGDLVSRVVENQLDYLVHGDNGKLTRYLDDKHTTLKAIVTSLEDVTRSCEQAWDESPLHPSLHCQETGQNEVHPGYGVPASSMPTAPSSQLSGIVDGDSMDTDSAGLDGPDGARKELEEHLRSRGSGTYTCTFGMSCKKGGVEDGKLRVFKRNSEFRMHMERHDKPYTCDLPGCPNGNKGFSRLDLLQRHKKNVRHKTNVPWSNETIQKYQAKSSY